MSSFESLLGALWLKPALVLGAAALVTLLLRRVSAAARHLVWAGALLATLALPALSWVFPPLRVPVSIGPPGAPGTVELPVAPIGAAARPALTRIPALSATAFERWDAAGLETVLVRLLLTVWGIGALLLIARRIGSERQVRKLIARARPAGDPRLARQFQELVRAAGIPEDAPVELRFSAEIAGPAAAGVRRPVILLPDAALEWSDAQRVQVLTHELGHVARRDCLLNLLSGLAADIYWPNPLVRAAVRRARSESERACDDLVLSRGGEALGYAELLFGLARAAQARPGGELPEAAASLARPRELESRLLAVLDGAPRRPLPRGLAAALAGFGLALALPAAALSLDPAQERRALGQPRGPEPDRVADSVASPSSERIRPAPPKARVDVAARRASAGPDSLLARTLVAALARQPRSAEDLVRERAAWALAQERDGRLVEPLLAALGEPDWRVRATAAWALAAARDPRATPGLLAQLAHPVWRLRAMAAHALAMLAGPEATPAMETALSDPAWQVRVEAVEYFARLGGPDAQPLIRARLGDRHVAVRHAAQAALTP